MSLLKKVADGWRLSFQSFKMLFTSFKNLLGFTCILSLCFALVAASIAVSIQSGYFDALSQPTKVTLAIFAGLLFLGLFFFTVILIGALYHYFIMSFKGVRDFKESMRQAKSKAGVIVIWSFLELVFGIIISYSIPIGPFVNALITWLVMLVTPILVMQDVSIVTAIRESAHVALRILGQVIGSNLWALCVLLLTFVIFVTIIRGTLGALPNLFKSPLERLMIFPWDFISFFATAFIVCFLSLFYILLGTLIVAAIYAYATGRPIDGFTPGLVLPYLKISQEEPEIVNE